MSTGTYLNFVLSLIFVIGLIGVVAWAYRRFALGGRLGFRAGGGRLDVVETRAIDAKRRLVLVRRDGVEHLILIGASGETVVETGISRPVTAAPAAREGVS